MAFGRGISDEGGSEGLGRGPQRLRLALTELIALRGYARPRGDADLQSAWRSTVGETTSKQTRAVAIRRGVLHVGVAHAALLAELSGFHRQTLLEKMTRLFPHLKIRDLKFKLDSSIHQ
jgi:Dna[CI] antecedent, DciA